MYDLKGTGDLELDLNGDLIIERTPGSLFKKAVISPKGYLAIEYAPNQYIDSEYGNNVYFKIQENLNNNLLANISIDVREAVSFVNVPTTNIEASIDSLSTINYLITYKDNTTEAITINV